MSDLTRTGEKPNPVMEVRSPSSMSESQKLPIPFSQKGFRENYVPFVDPTEARNWAERPIRAVSSALPRHPPLAAG